MAPKTRRRYLVIPDPAFHRLPSGGNIPIRHSLLNASGRPAVAVQLVYADRWQLKTAG